MSKANQLSRRIACAFGALGYLLSLESTVRASEPELSITPVRRAPVALDLADFEAVKAGPAGELYVLKTNPLAIIRIAPGGSAVSSIPLAQAPAGATVWGDLAVDLRGNLYVPAVWRDNARLFHAAALVFDSTGLYLKTIDFTPAIELRHLAINSSGELFALGHDGAYAKGMANQDLVIHKYSGDGRQIAAFSDLAQDKIAVGSEQWRQTRRELDQGQLIARGDLLYQVMPRSALVRVFRSSGDWLRDVQLIPPQAGGGTALDYVWRLVILADGNFLVHWVHSQRDGGSLTHTPYLALHDPTGAALSAATPQPWTRSFPVMAGGPGECYFLRELSGGSAELILAKIQTW